MPPRLKGSEVKPPAAGRPLPLAEFRKRTGQSQAKVASAMGVTQSSVSRTERQDDVHVSTLAQYVEAVGGRLRLMVDLDGHTIELDVVRTNAEAAPQEFRIIWQDPGTRRLVHVGWLEAHPDRFVYSYTSDARAHSSFPPFPAFPDLATTYESTDLFAFFSARLISAADPSFDATLEALGLTRTNATPVELLTRAPSGSPHDTIQVVPEPKELPDGTLERLFLVSGSRHAHTTDPEGVAATIAALPSGTALSLNPEPANPQNPDAIQVRYHSEPVGWIPDYLVDEVHHYLTSGTQLEVTVVQASGPDTPWHLRLLCRVVAIPPTNAE